MTVNQFTLANGIRACADGSIVRWTRGQVRTLEEAVARADETDLAHAAESILECALELLLAERQHPGKRP
jgi:hypothetical protein